MLPKNQGMKKVYESPTLVVYGDLAEMTKASSNKGQKDGGSKNTSRTA